MYMLIAYIPGNDYNSFQLTWNISEETDKYTEMF